MPGLVPTRKAWEAKVKAVAEVGGYIDYDAGGVTVEEVVEWSL